MAGNGGVSSSRVASETRFAPQPQEERQSLWSGCFGGMSCFGSQKGGKRIVPASRIPDGNASTSRGNGTQSAVNPNQNSTLSLSLLAPPSSPASFTNSALPSTAQSPNCFLSISANSPCGGPSSTMFATGPYAHETQLVSPPAFSTYTTEPSTAPLTPPPELAHPTTPSSPDVPFARFLSSSLDLKRDAGKDNGGMPFMSSGYVYPLYHPGSPSSSLISPASGTPRTGMTSPFPEREREVVPTRWVGCIAGAGDGDASHSKLFGPATSAQFYLDQAQQFPYGGKLNATSRDSVVDVYSSRISKACKQDAEEIEAYRASFGFSADEIITTQNYVEISDPPDYSFTMSPFANGENELTQKTKLTAPIPKTTAPNGGSKLVKCASISLSDGSELTFHRTPEPLVLGKRNTSSSSDAEIDYRRARSLRDGILAWRSSLP